MKSGTKVKRIWNETEMMTVPDGIELENKCELKESWKELVLEWIWKCLLYIRYFDKAPSQPNTPHSHRNMHPKSSTPLSRHFSYN